MNGKDYLEKRGYVMARPHQTLGKRAIASFWRRLGKQVITVHSYPPTYGRHWISYNAHTQIELNGLTMNVELFSIFEDQLEEKIPEAERVVRELIEWAQERTFAPVELREVKS